MMPETRPLRVTIVDMLGSFIPGVIWIILFLAAFPWLSGQQPRTTMSPFRTLTAIISIGSDTTVTNQSVTVKTGGGWESIPKGGAIPAYILIALGALLIGFTLKGMVNRIAELIARPDAIWHWWQNRKNKAKYRDFIFPYNNHLSKQRYFQVLTVRLRDTIGLEYTTLPALQPFSGCKRVLQQLASGLWEELEHAEAESRLSASLLIASVVSTMLGFIAWRASWYLTSLIATLIFVYSFRSRRKREVDYCYLNFLIATAEKVTSRPPSL